MSDATYPKNSTWILWLVYYWGSGSVLYSRPCRRESGHKLQETGIRIWRPAQGLLTTLQQQAEGNRRCQIHQSNSLVHPTPPVADWPLPTVTTNAQKFNFAGSRQKKGIFPVPQTSWFPSQTSGHHCLLLYSIHHWNGTKEAQFPLLWIYGWEIAFHLDITSALWLKDLRLNFCCREGKSKVWVCISQLEKQPW